MNEEGLPEYIDCKYNLEDLAKMLDTEQEVIEEQGHCTVLVREKVCMVTAMALVDIAQSLREISNTLSFMEKQ